MARRAGGGRLVVHAVRGHRRAPARADRLDTGTFALVLLLPPLIATNGGRILALALALVSALGFNFFFTQPYDSLRIEASSSIAAFAHLHRSSRSFWRASSGASASASAAAERRARDTELLQALAAELIRCTSCSRPTLRSTLADTREAAWTCAAAHCASPCVARARRARAATPSAPRGPRCEQCDDAGRRRRAVSAARRGRRRRAADRRQRRRVRLPRRRPGAAAGSMPRPSGCSSRSPASWPSPWGAHGCSRRASAAARSRRATGCARAAAVCLARPADAADGDQGARHRPAGRASRTASRVSMLAGHRGADRAAAAGWSTTCSTSRGSRPARCSPRAHADAGRRAALRRCRRRGGRARRPVRGRRRRCRAAPGERRRDDDAAGAGEPAREREARADRDEAIGLYATNSARAPGASRSSTTDLACRKPSASASSSRTTG